MERKKLKELCGECAEQISAMVDALKSRGFSEPQAIQLVSGMLSSPKVYMPFVDSVMGDSPSQYHH